MQADRPSDSLPSWSRDQLIAVASRLRGDLVASPVIGGLTLPAGLADVDLRIKAESLQPTGTPFIRGAMYWFGRQLGARRGIVVNAHREPPGGLAALVRAARMHRLPLEVCGAEAGDLSGEDPGNELDRPHASWIPGDIDTAAQVVTERAASGWTEWPGWGQGDAAAGLASLGWELGVQLPADTPVVVVADQKLLQPVQEGLRLARLEGPAGGEPVRVVVADPAAEAADLGFLRAATGLGLTAKTCPAVLATALAQVGRDADRSTAICAVL